MTLPLPILPPSGRRVPRGTRAGGALPAMLAAVAALAATPFALAQTDYFEGFNDVTGSAWSDAGPDELIDRGWTFRNQDEPETVTPAWLQAYWFTPQEGSEALQTGVSNLFDVNPVSISHWAILPDLPELAAGDVVTIWTQGYAMPGNDTAIEIRLAPGGGTDTGSGAMDVGDFTVLLASIVPGGSWQPTESTVPSGGRLAVRYHGANLNTNGGNGAYAAIDALAVGPPSIDPLCNPPMPEPGQSVAWTAAGGPYKVCADMTIPAGATVQVEPGAVIEFQDFAVLEVRGELLAAGTAAQPIQLTTDATDSQVRLRAAGDGVVSIEHGLIGVRVQTSGRGGLQFTDCTLQASPALGFLSRTGFVALEQCTVQGGLSGVAGTMIGTIALRDVTVVQGDLELAGFQVLDGLTLQQGQLRLIRDYQRTDVGRVTISNPGEPALLLRSGSDVRVGPDVDIQASGPYPIQLQGGGLTADSLIPGDAILGPVANEPGGLNGRFHWPDLGVPYVLEDGDYFSVNATFEPGITIRMAPGGSLLLFGDLLNDVGRVKGRPGRPIRFESMPGAQGSWSVGAAGGVNQLEHVVIDGAGLGVTAPQSFIDVRESTIRGCTTGAQPSGFGLITARGTRFLDNQVGVIDDPIPIASGVDVAGTERANIFQGNALAVDFVLGSNGEINEIAARDNWWGHPTGPRHPSLNPGGLGDPVTLAALFQPWRTTEPDLDADTAPVVTMDRPFVLAEPGDVVVIQWDVQDDTGVVSQTILLEADGGGAFDPVPIETGLPGDQRSYLWQVPDIGGNPAARRPVLRVQAEDAAGHVGFDQATVHIPADPHDPGGFEFTSNLGGPFLPGEEIDVCWQGLPAGTNNVTVFVVLEGDGQMYRDGSGTAGCLSGILRMPLVSTDTARVAVRAESGGNHWQWFFSEPFEIRPDSRLGDAPPQVSIQSPLGPVPIDGGTVPITWQASDDDGLRDVRLQASCNGGRTWHTIATDLPPATSSYTWTLPPSDGSASAIVRVVAFDTLFQNSADQGDPDAGVAGDADGDGVVEVDDLVAVILAWGPCPAPPVECPADLDGDGEIGVGDLVLVVLNWTG